MPTDEMLLQRFATIRDMIQMEAAEVESNYGLRPGADEGAAYRKGTIVAICSLSIEELTKSIEDEAKKE